VFLIGDAPLENQLEDSINIDQPQIYFGEDIDQYAVVGTSSDEFDFITGYSYDGKGGIPMSSFFSRLAFAFRFGAMEPLISGIITDDSEVMFARDVTERARRIAPFLQYDSDPYPIVVEGGISYVIDAYTTTDRFPYGENADVSQLTSASGLRRNFNYVRNSVKVVVDAYDGTVDFYVVDTEDPLIQAYSQAFEGLFQDASAMPDDVADHLRYPRDLFGVQTGMWGRYQLDNVGDFFTGDLGWSIADNPDSVSGGQAITSANQADPTGPRVADRSRPVDPYYQVTQLPDEDEPSYVVSRSFVPSAVPELTAYFVGRNDREGNLELRQYEMSSGNNVAARGPVQIDEILNSNPEISEESTELGRGGSQWLSGNLMLLLVEDSVIYVRPFYVQREPLPESPKEKTEPQVKFVAVVQEQRLGFAPTYAGALAELFGLTLEEAAGLVGASVPDVIAADDSGVSGTIDIGEASDEIVARLDAILDRFADADQALPDFAEYERLQSDALADLQELLDQIQADEGSAAEATGDDEPDSA